MLSSARADVSGKCLKWSCTCSFGMVDGPAPLATGPVAILNAPCACMPHTLYTVVRAVYSLWVIHSILVLSLLLPFCFSSMLLFLMIPRMWKHGNVACCMLAHDVGSKLQGAWMLKASELQSLIMKTMQTLRVQPGWVTFLSQCKVVVITILTTLGVFPTTWNYYYY